MKKFLGFIGMVLLMAVLLYVELLIIYQFDLSYGLLGPGNPLRWLMLLMLGFTFAGATWVYQKVFSKLSK